LQGSVALIFDTLKKGVVFETKGFEKRGITEPAEENVAKGPRDAFIEVLRVNTALIRRRIVTPKLRMYERQVGKECAAAVAVVYVEGVADEKLVSEIKERIDNLPIGRVVAAGSIEEGIIDHKYSFVPQTIYTERPDKLCANIMEGKIGLLIDGYPTAYIIPAVFNMFFQSPEDYSKNYFQGSVIRVLRYTAAFLSLVLPAFYISITMFHHEMIPTILSAAIIKSKLAVPFTPFVEVLIMMIAFEILLESGMRLPKSIGQTISIIGGLVIGDAAVNANLVSPDVVVAVAITGICGFIIPSQDLANSFRAARLGLVVCAGLAGLYGLSVGLMAMLYYLCTMTSFQIPYMDVYPSKRGKMTVRDGVFRLPWGRKTSNE
jgi:spore germination protein KA